jgi:nicotinamide mononucleotide transporter
MAKNFLKWIEPLAVVSSLLYTVLLTYGNVWCWLFALFSALFYGFICWQKRLLAESVLQSFYLAMAIYGYLNWGAGLADAPAPLASSTHVLIILGGVAFTALSGFFLKASNLNAAKPYVDSFTTVFSILATWLMVQLYPTNWAYWIIIDAVSIYLYFSRKLYLTAGLFFLYTLLSINGLIEWNF